MNERIKQLAEQAGIEFTYDPTEVPMRAFIEAWEGDLEKFAELILKETISVLQKRFMGDLNREDMEVRRCIADVKKHFGVE
jgi:hypothetical protein